MELFADLALILWGGVSMYLYSRYTAPQATLLSFLIGTMFLPESRAIDPPILPPITKVSVISFWALVGSLVYGRARLASSKPFRGLDLLFILVLIGNVGTFWTNPDAIITGPVVRQGLGPYDALADCIKDTLNTFLAFFVGRAMLRDSKDLNELTRLFVKGGLVYTGLALVELRMSPQLHRWVYGYHQMDFSMTIRYGGYRPMIYMTTGMAVGMFLLIAALMAFARWKVKLEKIWVPLWITVIMVLCKSTGAIIYAVAVLPLAAYVKKPKLRTAAFLAWLVMLYPILRATDTFPADEIVEYAEMINEERALSLWFRFDQEGQILERARERFAFGWGGYDRLRIFDPHTGEDLTITDGDWGIVIGQRGLVGFFGMYGLLGMPAVIAARRIRHIKDKKDRILLAALTLSAALLVVDLLPNGMFNSLPIFLMGAVYGISGGILEKQAKDEAAARQAKRAERARQRDPQRFAGALDGASR